MTRVEVTQKFRKLLALSENLFTGYFGNKPTEFGPTGFNLYSQVAELVVHFNPELDTWMVICICHDYDAGESFMEEGKGWNELIQFLCKDSDLAWFMYMSEEQIQECKI